MCPLVNIELHYRLQLLQLFLLLSLDADHLYLEFLLLVPHLISQQLKFLLLFFVTFHELLLGMISSSYVFIFFFLILTSVGGRGIV